MNHQVHPKPPNPKTQNPKHLKPETLNPKPLDPKLQTPTPSSPERQCPAAARDFSAEEALTVGLPAQALEL